MKKWLYTAALMGLTALPITAAAEDKFTVRVDGLQNGHFAQRHLLSEAYGFGCTGGNIAPTISWKNAPKGTKSFVLTMYDKDAPTGLGWMHWVVANIPAHVHTLPENQPLPQGALHTRTDGGTAGGCGNVAHYHRRRHARAGGLFRQRTRARQSQSYRAPSAIAV